MLQQKTLSIEEKLCALEFRKPDLEGTGFAFARISKPAGDQDDPDAEYLTLMLTESSPSAAASVAAGASVFWQITVAKNDLRVTISDAHKEISLAQLSLREGGKLAGLASKLGSVLPAAEQKEDAVSELTAVTGGKSPGKLRKSLSVNTGPDGRVRLPNGLRVTPHPNHSPAGTTQDDSALLTNGSAAFQK